MTSFVGAVQNQSRCLKTIVGIALNIIESDRPILRGWRISDYIDFNGFVSDENAAHSSGCLFKWFPTESTMIRIIYEVML